jgi:polysaccharide biosynthesis protein PslG
MLSACGPAPAPASPSTTAATVASVKPAQGPVARLVPSPVVAGSIPTGDPAIHIFLWENTPTTARDLKLVQDGGFSWVKQRFEWRNVEGRGKGQFEWQEPDRIVDAISQAGLKIIARVDNQPRWASTKVEFPATAPPDDLTDWTDYLSALAGRYRGRIQAYEIWNEPNLAREWGEQKPDPVAYTAMLKASYQAIKAADPQALVVSAGMSPTTESSDQVIPDTDFYRAIYAAGAKGSFDILGVHAVAFKAEPCADPAVVAADPALTNNDPSPVTAKRIYAFRHVEDIRQIMVENGDSDKQMGVLEMGWTIDARPGSPYAWYAVDRDTQGRNLVAAFECARRRWAPWMGFMSVIYIPDPRWTQQQEQYWWSIVNPDGSARPAYNALRGFLTR